MIIRYDWFFFLLLYEIKWRAWAKIVCFSQSSMRCCQMNFEVDELERLCVCVCMLFVTYYYYCSESAVSICVWYVEECVSVCFDILTRQCLRFHTHIHTHTHIICILRFDGLDDIYRFLNQFPILLCLLCMRKDIQNAHKHIATQPQSQPQPQTQTNQQTKQKL